MNAEELNSLLEKYYNGESTEAEERTLREYFIQKNIPEGYEAEKEIFGYYNAAGEVPEPSHGFETRILTGIDASENKSKSFDFRRYLLPFLSAAASILVLAGSYFFFAQRIENKNTYSDPKIAYAETMKILMDVSSKMNRATLALEPVSKINKMTTKSFEAINKSTGIIEKNLKELDYLKETVEKHKLID
jgi:hypothetical protein